MTASSHWLIGVIIVLGMAAMLTRFRSYSEATWAGVTAVLLVLTLQVTPAAAWHAVARGHDVYLFLIGMMLLAEVSRRSGLFDWLAGHLVNRARGSSFRLFGFVYLAGIVVTAFMSNDATAVVLTPAVVAACRRARISNPLPALYACALVANAASFLLPIANPANLVVFGQALPAFQSWLQQFFWPSVVALLLTFLCLVVYQRGPLRQSFDAHYVPVATLSPEARVTACAGVLMACVLVGASWFGLPLGWPSALMGVVSLLLVAPRNTQLPWLVVKSLSWSVLPLVAGLFVMVEGVSNAGLTPIVGAWLSSVTQAWPALGVWAAGLGSALASNAVNNLPAGLFAAAVLDTTEASHALRAATLIGINLGPNLTLTGSLATLLWLAALRREGMNVSAWQFFKLGLVTLPLPLVAALWLVS